MDRSEVIKWLDSYIDIKRERDGILRQIRELEQDRAASQLRSPQLTGMPRSGRMSDPTAESAARFEGLVRRYEDKAAQLVNRMREIEDAIGTVDNALQRDMLRAHYLRGLEWEDVAREKSYSVASCTRIAGQGISEICGILKADRQ